MECSHPSVLNLTSPKDPSLFAALEGYCPRCGEMLAFDMGRDGRPMITNNHTFGVTEAPAMFERQGWIYMLAAQSAWDSAYYSTFYIAAQSVPELATGSTSRIAGRFLIPSQGQSFGSGQVIRRQPALGGADNISRSSSPTTTTGGGGGGGGGSDEFVFVHHHLNHTACAAGVGVGCARDVWQSLVRFEDRGDGKGDVYIVPIFPAEDR